MFLNESITNFRESIFGLDLSDISVKVFQLEKNGEKYEIRSFGSQSIPEKSFEDGVVIDKEKIILAIQEAVRKAGPKKINTKKVICSISESKAFLRVLNIPQMDEDSAKEAVKWEIEASIPLSIDNVYYDWQFINGENRNNQEVIGEKKQDILTVAVAKKTVDGLMEVLKGAGLDVYGLEPESIASVRSLIDKNESQESCLIVDLGSKRTSFIITKGNIPFFTSSIHFSSEGITDALAKHFGISVEAAEKMKISKGLENSEEENSIIGVVKPILENLISEIEKTIDFFENISDGENKIKKIILSGGGANLKGLIPYLSTKLNKEIEGGDPWINLGLNEKLPPISRENSISYSTVIGLAISATEYEN